MKNTLFTILLLISLSAFSQKKEKETIIYGDQLTEEEIYDIQTDGWMILKYKEQDLLMNFSNEDYLLWFKINCKQSETEPSFLIEFTNNYRDGNRGGIDFASSKKDNYKKIVFLIDGKSFENPFKNYDENHFIAFKNFLKEAKTLSIEFYDNEFNIETEKDELVLNRVIDFKLKNSELLDVLTDCE